MTLNNSIWFKSLFNGLAWFFTGLSLVLFFFISILFFEQEQLAKQIHLENEITAYDAEFHIQESLNSYVDDVLFLSSLPKQLAEHDNTEIQAHLNPLIRSYLQYRQEIVQVRWLNNQGVELVRFNKDGKGNIERVANHKLQDKASRYYFQDAIDLVAGQVAVSALDLNVENNKIELPFKPVIRFSSPVYISDNEQAGVIVINVCAKKLLSSLKALRLFPQQALYLADDQGAWIIPPEGAQAWGIQRGLANSRIIDSFPRLASFIEEDFWLDNYWVENKQYLHALTITPFIEWQQAKRIAVNRADSFLLIIEKPEPETVMESVLNSQYVVRFIVITMLFLIFSSLITAFYFYRRERVTQESLFHQRLFDHYFDRLPEAMILAGAKGELIFQNKRSKHLFQQFNFAKDDVSVSELMMTPAQRATEFRYMRAHQQQQGYENKEIELTLDGITFTFLRQAFLVEDENKQLNYLAIIFIDLTSEKHLENAMRQSQKMDAIGSLTGGIAHDFNNLLTGIMGNMDLAKSFMPIDEDKSKELIDQSLNSAQKAADLIKRLMLIARNKPMETQSIAVNEFLLTEKPLLQTSLPSKIEFSIQPYEQSVYINVDEISFETALLNLVSNARDAVQDVADPQISMMVKVVDFAQHEAAYPGLVMPIEPSKYIAIEVTDNGKGMSEQVLQKVLEPFFTTKEVGKGTGLGLAMVYGFIKQANGSMAITSAEGVGSSITLFIPQANAASPNPMQQSADAQDTIALEQPQATPSNGMPIRHQIVCLVDDDQEILKSVVAGIQDSVKACYAFPSAVQALEFSEILAMDVVITDIRMSDMNGIEFAQQLLARGYQGKLVFASGFLKELQSEFDAEFADYPLLEKPYRIEQLLALLGQ